MPAPLLPQLLIDAPIPVASLDLEGRLVDANRALLDAGGYHLQEIRGRSFAEFLDPEFLALLPSAPSSRSGRPRMPGRLRSG